MGTLESGVELQVRSIVGEEENLAAAARLASRLGPGAGHQDVRRHRSIDLRRDRARSPIVLERWSALQFDDELVLRRRVELREVHRDLAERRYSSRAESRAPAKRPLAMDFPAVSTMLHAEVALASGRAEVRNLHVAGKVSGGGEDAVLEARVSGTVVLLYWRNSAGPT
jgi:hypothetical protein